jgi:hypothetical protein
MAGVVLAVTVVCEPPTTTHRIQASLKPRAAYYKRIK